MIQAKIKIIKNIEVTENYYKIVLLSKPIAKQAKPGQFVHVRVSDKFDPLLRRPLSVHRVNGENFEILYEVKGKGTKILSQREPGEYLDVIGPLGNGFVFRETRNQSTETRNILVAGGIGVAPLVFLAERLRNLQTPACRQARPNSKLQTLVLIGANTKHKVLCVDEFKKLGCRVQVATDDGTVGFKGRVTQLLEKILRGTRNEERGTIYACGPDAMLESLAKITKLYKLECQVSLENFMGCGIGACLGCVVKIGRTTHNAQRTTIYQRVCKDGPVFDINKIIF